MWVRCAGAGTCRTRTERHCIWDQHSCSRPTHCWPGPLWQSGPQRCERTSGWCGWWELDPWRLLTHTSCLWSWFVLWRRALGCSSAPPCGSGPGPDWWGPRPRGSPSSPAALGPAAGPCHCMRNRCVKWNINPPLSTINLTKWSAGHL